MLSARELRAMRETQDSAMPDLVDIRRRGYTDDGFGGVTLSSTTTIATGVAARVSQAQVIKYLGRIGRDLNEEQYTVRLPHGTDVQDEDFLDWEGITLLVMDVKPRSWATATTVSANRQK